MLAHRNRWVSSSIAATVLVSLLGGWVVARPARAAEKTGTSLDWVPANAVFYASSQRIREQIDLVAGSKAWARLNSMPYVQMAWQMAQAKLGEPGGFLQTLEGFKQDPQNVDLIELGKDMMSSEVSFYGDASCLDFVDLVQQLSNLQRYSQFSALFNQAGIEPANGSMKLVLNHLAANLNAIHAPNIIIAFKLNDEKRALAQLKRLEMLLGQVIAPGAPLPVKFSRGPAGAADLLTLTLVSKAIPWESIPFQILEDTPGQYDALIEKLKTLDLAISLGTRDGYLLLSIGETNSHVEALGKGPLLVDAPELAPLRAKLKERLTGVNYANKEMALRMTTSPRDIDDFVQMAEELIPQAQLEPSVKKRMVEDVGKLGADIKKALPEAGPVISFSYLTPRGYEIYAYDSSENRSLDGTKPLSLIDHVGGSPLVAIVGRTQYYPEQYETMVKWLKVFHGYFEEIALPTMSESERTQYKEGWAKVQPLVARWSDVTRTMLIPSLKDSQAALVLDAKIKSSKWLGVAPQLGELPMLEPAIVVSVSDSALLEKAMGEYRKVLDDLVTVVGQLGADSKAITAVRNFLASGAARKLGPGTMYSFTIPPEAQLDDQIKPNGAMTTNVAVLSLGSAESERVLTPTPFAGVPTQGDLKRPLAAVGHVNWPAIVDRVEPWVGEIVRQNFVSPDAAPKGPQAAAGDSPMVKMILDQTHTACEVLKALREISSVTYLEGKTTVTHVEIHVEDIE